MKVKVATMKAGPGLDWAVAKSKGLPIRKDPMGFGKQSPGGYWIWPDNWPPKPAYAQIGCGYSPSTKWDQGGPIIEEHIPFLECDEFHSDDRKWLARTTMGGVGYEALGATSLEAAVKCFVASRLGGEIDIPEELC